MLAQTFLAAGHVNGVCGVSVSVWYRYVFCWCEAGEAAMKMWLLAVLRIELDRDVIDTTRIGDYIDRYEMGDLHARMRGIPIPCCIGVFLLTGKWQIRYRGTYKLPYKHHPIINGVYTPPEAFIAEGYAAGGGALVRRT